MELALLVFVIFMKWCSELLCHADEVGGDDTLPSVEDLQPKVDAALLKMHAELNLQLNEEVPRQKFAELALRVRDEALAEMEEERESDKWRKLTGSFKTSHGGIMLTDGPEDYSPPQHMLYTPRMSESARGQCKWVLGVLLGQCVPRRTEGMGHFQEGELFSLSPMPTPLIRIRISSREKVLSTGQAAPIAYIWLFILQCVLLFIVLGHCRARVEPAMSRAFACMSYSRTPS